MVLSSHTSGIKAEETKITEDTVGLAKESGGNLATIKTNTDNLANVPKKATTPTIYNVTMTNANTEYSQALPTGTKRFSMHIQTDDVAYRIAFVTGKVATPTAPYYTVGAQREYYEGELDLTGKTIYFACGTAGKTMEIQVWV